MILANYNHFILQKIFSHYYFSFLIQYWNVMMKVCKIKWKFKWWGQILFQLPHMMFIFSFFLRLNSNYINLHIFPTFGWHLAHAKIPTKLYRDSINCSVIKFRFSVSSEELQRWGKPHNTTTELSHHFFITSSLSHPTKQARASKSQIQTRIEWRKH